MLESSALAAIASPRRREILRLVWDDERQAGAIAQAMPDVTFGAVSLQLRALLQAGLVESRRRAGTVLSRASRRARPVAGILEQMWGDALWRLKLQAELEETRRGRGRQAEKEERERKKAMTTSAALPHQLNREVVIRASRSRLQVLHRLDSLGGVVGRRFDD